MWGIWKFRFEHTWLQVRFIVDPLIFVGIQFCAPRVTVKKNMQAGIIKSLTGFILIKAVIV